MTLITRIGATLMLLAVALPMTSSTATGSKSCKSKEFWSDPNGCCLPVGGPPSPPPPPQGTTCPPTSHYWGQKQGCCVPRNPPPEHGPPPQCPKGWEWNTTVRKCEIIHTPPPTPPSHPSPSPSHHHGGNQGGHGNGHGGSGGNGHDNGHGHGNGGGNDHDNGHGNGNGGGHGYRRRGSSHLKSRSASLCPANLDACPISGVRTGDYECLDTTTELESCGGCVSLGKGQDCTVIPGAWNVGCEEGSCAVYTCAGGFKRAPDGRSCIAM